MGLRLPRVGLVAGFSLLLANLGHAPGSDGGISSKSQEGEANLLQIRSDGTRRVVVLANVGVRGWDVRDLSPDRRRLVFSHGCLCVASVSGSYVHRLRVPGTGVAAAVWSPDGTKI